MCVRERERERERERKRACSCVGNPFFLSRMLVNAAAPYDIILKTIGNRKGDCA